jgi:hypothetical protein
LKQIANDIKLAYLTLYKRFDKQSAGVLGIRYFSLGEIIFTNEYNQYQGQKNPNEFTLDGSYSRMFSDKFSGGIAFRYIRSDLSAGAGLSTGQAPTHAGTAFAVDISSYYHTPVTLNNRPAELAFGINISNMGSKISYTDAAVKDFLPANLRLGTSLTMELDSYNKITFALDVNKLLVPSPPWTGIDSTTGKTVILKGMDPTNISVPTAMIRSFYDAPTGIGEELKEYTLGGGIEYLYRDQFAIRGGYFNESAMKGNRKYMTLGIGVKMTTMMVDFSYLVPNAGSSSPLANTMRFTFSFNFGKPKKQKDTIKE